MKPGVRRASPRVAVVEAGHDLQQARLAGAVGADHADLGARVERQRDVLQHRAVGRVEAGQLVAGVDELVRHAAFEATGGPRRVRPASLPPGQRAEGLVEQVAARGGIGGRHREAHQPTVHGALGVVLVAVDHLGERLAGGAALSPRRVHVDADPHGAVRRHDAEPVEGAEVLRRRDGRLLGPRRVEVAEPQQLVRPSPFGGDVIGGHRRARRLTASRRRWCSRWPRAPWRSRRSCA